MRTKAYIAWFNMKQRCDNPNHPSYRYYGEKGISYDPRWKLFSNFVEDMGSAPAGLTLERKDRNKDYNKENCVWATWTEQANNKGKRSDNSSGVQGVSFQTGRGVWVARTGRLTGRQLLYRGSDFFEACCARKSWDARQ